MASAAALVALALCLPVCAFAGIGGVVHRGYGVKWDYKGFHIGDWPAKGYPLCAGKPAGPEHPHNEWQEAPIDIPVHAVLALDTDSLTLTAKDGGCRKAVMEHDGHTWEASFSKAKCGNLVATWRGKEYTMAQLHFHFESENTLGGHHQDMEVHLVHKAKDGAVLVIAVFAQHAGFLSHRTFGENGFLRRLFNMGFMPSHVSTAALLEPYSSVMSEGEEFYTFLGSFTTPPCTPNVEWVVMQHPIPISDKHLFEFEHFLKRANQTNLFGRDDRPLQPLHGRPIKIGSISAISSGGMESRGARNASEAESAGHGPLV